VLAVHQQLAKMKAGQKNKSRQGAEKNGSK
jgi:hypothetical protein